jgi:tetratricopeptide (TPR) repeat protein
MARPRSAMRSYAKLLTILVCVGVALPAFSGEPQWVEIRSPHFSVITDAGDKRGRDVAVRFEQMRAVFGALMVKAKVSTPIPLQIIAFRNSKELRQFSPIWRGKATEVAGLFQGDTDRCFILLDMSVENPWQTVFHEYAHQLMNGTMSTQLDPWFEEGFAEYFRTIVVDGKDAYVGKVPDDEYYVLANTAWMKIADLLRVRQSSSTYNESGDHRTVLYAESGLLVHYIYDNSLIPKVAEYFDLVRNNNVSVESAIQQAFGMSAMQLDKALRNYFSSNRFRYYKLAAPAGIDGKLYTSTPMAAIDAQAILADAHLHSPDYQKTAAEEFEAVLRIDSNQVAALRGLGYSYLMKQDFEKAGEYFHKAAKLSSNDPRVLYYSALLSQREGSASFGSDNERLESMQSELEKSIKLDPEFADAYSMLAFTYMSQGKRDQAVPVLLKAIELNPRNEQYRFNLASLFLESQKFDEAMSVLRVLQSSGNPQIASRSTEELTQVQRYKEQARSTAQPSTQPVTGESLIVRSPSTPSEPEPGSPKIAGVTGAAKFLHGKLLSVDCSSPPAATLTILAGSTTWNMHAANSSKAIVIGADQISCDWKNQKVAVNYRETGDRQADIISLEVQ